MKAFIITYILISFTGVIFAQENLELYRGNKSFEKGDYESAKGHYQNALSDNPNSFKGTYNMANANYKEENLEDALAQYQQFQPAYRVPVCQRKSS